MQIFLNMGNAAKNFEFFILPRQIFPFVYFFFLCVTFVITNRWINSTHVIEH